MHGIVFQAMKAYVQEKYGHDAWYDLLDEADVPSGLYMPFSSYPDEEAVALVQTAADMTESSVPEVLEDFGRHIGPKLVEMYPTKVDPEWGALDLIENTEEQIHEVVRMDKPNADPPKLKLQRPRADVVALTYQSDRKLCDLAKGIAKGVGDYYDQSLEISEHSCMLDDDPQCEIAISR